jgi:hypothetical protein
MVYCGQEIDNVLFQCYDISEKKKSAKDADYAIFHVAVWRRNGDFCEKDIGYDRY